MAEIPIEHFDYLSSPYHVLRVDNIPPSIPLRELIKVVEPYCRSIIGVGRSADYTAKRFGKSVYYITPVRGDAEFLNRMPIQFVDDGREAQLLTIVDSVLARARLEDVKYEGCYENIPVAVYAKGTDRAKPCEGFSRMLINLLMHFDKDKSVTYIRLGYDNKKGKSRNDCYITYLSKSSAKRVLFKGVNKFTQHLAYGAIVEASLSPNVPIIMRLHDTYMLENNTVLWSPQVAATNQLMVRHLAPFVHPRSEEVDIYTGDVPVKLLPTKQASDSSSTEPIPASSRTARNKPRALTIDDQASQSSQAIGPIPSTSQVQTHKKGPLEKVDEPKSKSAANSQSSKLKSTIHKVPFKATFKPVQTTKVPVKQQTQTAKELVKPQSRPRRIVITKEAAKTPEKKKIIYDLSSDDSSDSDSEPRLIIDETVNLD